MASIRRIAVFVGLVVVVVVAAARLFPASTAPRSGISGTIIDLATERPLAGVRLSVGAAQAVTDADGRYHLPVAPGVHDVRLEAPGYIGMTHRYLSVAEDNETDLDLAMVPEHTDEAGAARIEAAFLRADEEAATRQAQVAAEVAANLAAGVDAQGIAPSAVTEPPPTLRVLMPDGAVVEMTVDEYLKGVVPFEMPPNWPAEALRAQAVAARSYAVSGAAHLDVGADVCTTTHCQAWSPTHYDSTDRAVEDTHGVTARYQGVIIRAFFHAHCDGRTRSTQESWGSDIPYCRSVACPCGYSSLYGHGVGMCQHGARALALEGFRYDEILKHFYTGVEVVGPASPTAHDASLSPTAGDQSTHYTFSVTYTSANGSPPAVANVVIDGRAHTLTLAPTQPERGRRYRLETVLPAGEHHYHFYLDDGAGHAVRLPATGEFAGPSVTPAGTPLAPAAEEGIGAGYVTFSTPADWAPGEHQGTAVGDVGDGALILAEGAASGTYTSPPIDAPLGFVALGVGWHAPTPGGSGMRLEVRTSPDGAAWGPWHEAEIDNEPDEGGATHSALLFGEGRALQYRVTLTAGPSGARPALEDLHFVCIDSRAGPSTQAAVATASSDVLSAAGEGEASVGMPAVIPRHGWGANEALMTAPPEYRPVTAMIVHHTATDDGGVDPAAMVRAIYYYHAVSREWGDIGYNFLIDKYGNIYEGRAGGSGVVGFHAAAYNWGSVGVSLIGNFVAADVPGPMRDALTVLLAAKAAEHWIDPLSQQHFIDRVLPTIMGHRDVGSTTCPGARAYALLPGLRSAVAAMLSSQPPMLRITAPASGAAVRGVVEIRAESSTPVGSAVLSIDEQAHGEPLSGGAFTWRWNTVGVAEGQHTIQIVAQTLGGQSFAAAQVHVDNTPPTGTATAPVWHYSTRVPITVTSPDAVAVQFSNGWVWEGEDLAHETGERVNDPEALNGVAWRGTAGGVLGWWYGPYALDLPTWANYQVYFRLKTPQPSGTTPLAFLDVVDNRSTRTYATRPLAGADFATPGYEEFPLDIVLGSIAPTYDGQPNGLEFRTWFQGVGDLYLDRVAVFCPPQPLPAEPWGVKPAEGEQIVLVRLLDRAGNAHDVPVRVQLDLTPPQVVEATGTSAVVRDTVSGLDPASAAWSSSTDGGRTWSPWRAVALPTVPTVPPTATVGITEDILLAAPEGTEGEIRLRVRNMAGHWLVLPARPVIPLIFRGQAGG